MGAHGALDQLRARHLEDLVVAHQGLELEVEQALSLGDARLDPLHEPVHREADEVVMALGHGAHPLAGGVGRPHAQELRHRLGREEPF